MLAEHFGDQLGLRLGRRQPGGEGDRRSTDSAAVGPSLADLGITHKQSSRWQKLAAIPEPDFEAHVRVVRTKGEKLTTAGTIPLLVERVAAAELERESAPGGR